MLAKVFLSSILAAVFAVCVIAAPADDPPPPDVNVVFESAPASVVAALATTTASGPPPTESTITPNQDDEITTSDASGDSDGVFGRDLESLGRVGPGPQPPPGCVTVYSDPFFHGIQVTICGFGYGVCRNFSWWWRFHISSIRPSPHTCCIIYKGPKCSGKHSKLFCYPGYGKLKEFDNNTGSIKCWKQW